jgi:hypothetical protein
MGGWPPVSGHCEDAPESAWGLPGAVAAGGGRHTAAWHCDLRICAADIPDASRAAGETCTACETSPSAWWGVVRLPVVRHAGACTAAASGAAAMYPAGCGRGTPCPWQDRAPDVLPAARRPGFSGAREWQLLEAGLCKCTSPPSSSQHSSEHSPAWNSTAPAGRHTCTPRCGARAKSNENDQSQAGSACSMPARSCPAGERPLLMIDNNNTS